MFSEISYYLVLGKPLIMWMGTVLFLFIAAAAILATFKEKVTPNHFKYHVLFARVAIVLALFHGIFGVLYFF